MPRVLEKQDESGGEMDHAEADQEIQQCVGRIKRIERGRDVSERDARHDQHRPGKHHVATARREARDPDLRVGGARKQDERRYRHQECRHPTYDAGGLRVTEVRAQSRAATRESPNFD